MCIITKFTQQQKYCHSKQIIVKTQEWNLKRRKGKYKVVRKFIERMKKIQEEAKVALGKAQKEMKKFINRKWGKERNTK